MAPQDLVTDADDKLFNLILYSEHHVSQSVLPEGSDFNYNLKPRPHNHFLLRHERQQKNKIQEKHTA